MKKRNPSFMDFIADVFLGVKGYTGKKRFLTPRTLLTYNCDICGIEFDVGLQGRDKFHCPDHTKEESL